MHQYMILNDYNLFFQTWKIHCSSMAYMFNIIVIESFYMNKNEIKKYVTERYIWFSTGKSLSEALIFASTNPQYDDGLFIELQVQYMKIPSSQHGENMLCTKIALNVRNNFVHNMFSLGWNLEFSCIKLVIQWTICHHIVGYLMQK